MVPVLGSGRHSERCGGLRILTMTENSRSREWSLNVYVLCHSDTAYDVDVVGLFRFAPGNRYDFRFLETGWLALLWLGVTQVSIRRRYDFYGREAACYVVCGYEWSSSLVRRLSMFIP